MLTSLKGITPDKSKKPVFTKDRWNGHEVTVATYRKRYVLVSAGNDQNTGRLWANEYFKEAQGAVDFCYMNGLEIVSEEIKPWKKMY